MLPLTFRDITTSNGPLDSNAKKELALFDMQRPVFVCVISYTATCEIPGITAAGANPQLLKFTSPADAEFLYYGYCKCIDKVPITPDGKPTPAIVTRAALKLSNIPFFVVDAGSKIKPSIPHVTFNLSAGKNIESGHAMTLDQVKQAFEYGNILGKQLARTNNTVIIGESIPGGTTTALGILAALGINARSKTSSSMPRNPHTLKNRIVSEGMKKANISFGFLRNDPLRAVSALGDPMVPSIAGIVNGVISTSRRSRVMLAGGTQMTAIIALLRSLSLSIQGISIGTTIYVTEDRSSNISDLINAISPEIRIYTSDPHLARSSYPGLQAFARGFVKEGVGAGGVSLAAMMKSNGQIDGNILLKEVEEGYRNITSYLD